MFTISVEITEKYLALETAQRWTVEFAICQYVGNNQRVCQDKLKGKRNFYSLAEKDNYESKFNEIYQEILEPSDYEKA